MPIEYFLALRFMREGRTQTALILGGVSVGVAVIVFLSSLIDGLQRSVIERTLGSQAHITLYAPDEVARPLYPRDSGGPVILSHVEPPAKRVRSIEAWQRVVRRLQHDPAVSATTAIVSGPAFVIRGQSTSAIRLYGIEAPGFDRIIRVSPFVTVGELDPSAGKVVLGAALARELSVSVKDRVRIETPGGGSQLFAIAGLFELGNKVADEQWAFVSMRAAQALLGLPGGATEIYARVVDLYEAERVAERLRSGTGLAVDSWMVSNAQLLAALRSQGASSMLIQLFVVIAVAMGIASVLVVSVVQRSRAIGIMRAMGVRRGRVLRLFLFQGAVYGGIGSVIGSALGIGLVQLFMSTATPLFTIELSAARIAWSCALAVFTGVMSAALPARRAAKLDPAVAIRNV